MNAVGKKTEPSRDFRNNYAQKARFKDGNIWLELTRNRTNAQERAEREMKQEINMESQ